MLHYHYLVGIDLLTPLSSSLFSTIHYLYKINPIFRLLRTYTFFFQVFGKKCGNEQNLSVEVCFQIGDNAIPVPVRQEKQGYDRGNNDCPHSSESSSILLAPAFISMSATVRHPSCCEFANSENGSKIGI